MALTKIKLNTMVTGTLPDANIPDDITIDTAAAVPASGLTGNTLASGVTASSLTSVGTLTGLASSGTIVLGDLDIIPTSSNVSVIKHDSGSGSLTLQGDQVNIKNRAGNETGLSYNDGGGVILSHNSKVTSSSADTTFKIETTSGTTIFPVLDFVSSHSSVGAKIRQDGSDVITIDNDQDVTFADDVTISGNTFMNGTYLAINNVGYIRSASNELRLQTGTSGLNVMNNAYNTSLLSISNAGNATFSGGTTTFPVGGIIRFGERGNLTHNSSNYDMTFNTNSLSSALVIKGTGSIGIGDTDPDALLSIKGNSDANTTPSIRLKDGSDTRECWISNTAGDLVLANGGNDNVPHCKIQMYDGNLMTFSTSNTERIRINSSGFVGIGDTTSGNALLDINKSTSSTDLPTANESFEGYRLILANPQLTNNATNALGFSMYNGEVCAYIATQTYYNGQYETDMIFGTRDDNRDDGIDDTVGDGLKEAFRIDHDSNIQFHGNMFGGGSKDAAPWNDSSGNGHFYYQKGTSALGATLALSTNVDVGGGYAGMYINLVNASASGDRMIAFGMDGNSAGQIHYSSSNQVAYATSGSDKRLKKNITNWTGDTLSKFANIEPKMFHWKTQDSSEDKIKGFIAQDMIENFPEAYPLGKMGEGDDQIERYQYNPSGMVIYLMKALKEQVAVNADLTSRIEALENA